MIPSHSSLPDRLNGRLSEWKLREDDDSDDWLLRIWLLDSIMLLEWFVKMSDCIACVADSTWPLILLTLVLNAASSHITYAKQHNESIDVQSIVDSIGIIVWNEYVERPFFLRILRPQCMLWESSCLILDRFVSNSLCALVYSLWYSILFEVLLYWNERK